MHTDVNGKLPLSHDDSPDAFIDVDEENICTHLQLASAENPSSTAAKCFGEASRRGGFYMSPERKEVVVVLKGELGNMTASRQSTVDSDGGSNGKFRVTVTWKMRWGKESEFW
jgi:hypothetical protein